MQPAERMMPSESTSALRDTELIFVNTENDRALLIEAAVGATIFHCRKEAAFPERVDGLRGAFVTRSRDVQDDDLAVEDRFHLHEIVAAAERLLRSARRATARAVATRQNCTARRVLRRELQIARILVAHRFANRPGFIHLVGERAKFFHRLNAHHCGELIVEAIAREMLETCNTVRPLP